MDTESLAAFIATINAIAAGGPVAWILGGLFAISELLPFISKTKGNGLIHLIGDKLKKKP